MNSRSPDGGTVSFSPVEYNDHAGYLWIVTILGMIYSSFSGLARACIKRGIYGVDDYLIGLATVSLKLIMGLNVSPTRVTWLTLRNLKLLLYCQSGVIFHGLKNGLAKSEEITEQYQWPTAGKVRCLNTTRPRADGPVRCSNILC
jgi:hypothetical protein